MSSLISKYGFFVALAGFYLYSFPYFAEIRSANELPRVYLTQAMAAEGTVAVDSGVRKWGTTADVSPCGGAAEDKGGRPPPGAYCSNKAPGSSMLAIPAYWVLSMVSEPTLASMTWAFRVSTGVIPSLVFFVFLWRFLRRFSDDDRVRRLVMMAYALGTMAMTYSVLFIAHQLSAVCIGSAYMLAVYVIEDRADRRWLLAMGVAAGCAPLVDYQASFAGIPVAVYVLWHLVRTRQWRGIAYSIAGLIPPVAALLMYHWRAFGHPLRTGYGASKTFAHFHQQGFLGMDQLRLEAFLGSTVSPDNGLIVFSPFLLLAGLGWLLMVRRPQWRAHLAITATVAAIYIAFISSIIFWRGGWQMGPRYITAMLPFLLPPITVAIAWADSRWPVRGLAVGLVIVSVVVYAVSCAEFPHFPEKFKNPLFELTFRLLADGKAPYNVGWLFGLRGFASVAPYLLALAAFVAVIVCPSRRHWRSASVGAVVAAAILVGYSQMPGGGPSADQAYTWVKGVMPQ